MHWTGGIFDTRSKTFAQNEVLVGTGFDDPARFHHMNLIRKHRGDETMVDDNGYLTGSNAAESRQPVDLGPRVHDACGFVQEDDRRPTEDGAS